MISFSQKGDFSKTYAYMHKIQGLFKAGKFDEAGRKGVEILRNATPRDTGKTADSWSYSVEYNVDSISIIWSNSNVQDGANIAVLLQYGHGTNNGGYVRGINYITPNIRPLFNELADSLWKEVTKR